MGIYRCDNVNGAGARCVLAENHTGKVPCRFKAEKASGPEAGGAADLPPTRMNKTETRYAAILEARRLAGEIKGFEYEALTLRLAARVTYRPDFFVVSTDGSIELHEVKGAHIWEDARVKLRVAAARFPAFRFYLAQYKAGRWTVTEIPK